MRPLFSSVPDLFRYAARKEIGQHSFLIGKNKEAVPGQDGATMGKKATSRHWGHSDKMIRMQACPWTAQVRSPALPLFHSVAIDWSPKTLSFTPSL